MRINDKYDFIRKIDKGGMSTLFLAEDIDNGNHVAIKILNVPRDCNIEEFHQKFFHEVFAMSRAKHPNIIPVYDYGLMGGTSRPFIVMKHLQGLTLFDVLYENRRPPLQILLDAFMEVLSALSFLHAKQITHKDIKPTNLFFENWPHTNAKLILLDFGISYHSTSNTTSGADFACTPQYCAPEYFLYHKVSPAIDVYQMGLVLVEMLTGVQAVEDSDLETCIEKHQYGNLKIPKPLFFGPLGDILNNALNADYRKRYPTANEFFYDMLTLDVDALETSLDMMPLWIKVMNTKTKASRAPTEVAMGDNQTISSQGRPRENESWDLF